MRLGFDLDGVITNMDKALDERLNEKFDAGLHTDMWTTFLIEDSDWATPEMIEYAIDGFGDPNFMGSLEPIDGAKEALDFLKKKGNSIHIITSRSKKLFKTTSGWLKDNHIPYDTLTLSKYKPRIAKELEVRTFMDDHYETLLDFINFRQSGYFQKLIVMDWPWNRPIEREKKIQRAYCWCDVLEILEQKGKGPVCSEHLPQGDVDETLRQ